MSRTKETNHVRQQPPSRLSYSGFTLIEVVVAVLILSLGVLGVAGLQIISTRSNFEGLQRSQATQLANDTIDRMRANPERLDSYSGTNLGNGTMTTEPAGCTSDMAEAVCLTARADRDRWELEQSADRSDALITPRICITNNVGGAGLGNVRVSVAWRGISRWEAAGIAPTDPCGQAIIGMDYLKQVTMTTYITPLNP